MAEFRSKKAVVSKAPYELYMAFVDMRNFVQFLPEDKKADVTADYDSIHAVVQGFSIGVRVKDRIPYSRIEFMDDGAPFKFFAKNREVWAKTESYTYPGPIQYWGPSEVCDVTNFTIKLERGALKVK